VTDVLDVQIAQIHRYAIDATVYTEPGWPDLPALRAEVVRRLGDYIRNSHRLGHSLVRDEISSAMHGPGVVYIELRAPAADRAIDVDTAIYNPMDPKDGTFAVAVSEASGG
jgi:phage-related baseplate assembly protein